MINILIKAVKRKLLICIIGITVTIFILLLVLGIGVCLIKVKVQLYCPRGEICLGHSASLLS